jgi:DNA topoisomerase I
MEKVWICPYPNGHIHAVGTDAAGRRQYLCHRKWQDERNEEKFDRVLAILESCTARLIRKVAKGQPEAAFGSPKPACIDFS